MIYGHGVETDQTLPARFGALTGRRLRDGPGDTVFICDPDDESCFAV
jgi:hypothetical protein